MLTKQITFYNYVHVRKFMKSLQNEIIVYGPEDGNLHEYGM